MYNFLQLSGIIGDKSNKYYLIYMAVRLLEMKRILKDTGSIYFHCDNTMGHYIKLLMDVIFGPKNFRNEIIWHYKRWTASSNKLQKLHDTLFWYTKDSQYYFDPPYVTSANEKKGIKESWILDEETNKYYRWQSLRGERYKIWKSEKGVKMGDVWEIPFLHPSAKERMGYPTQKPLALLERIIQTSCPPDGVVLDPFCGCATTCVAAEKLDREWVGIDISEKAFELVIQRLGKEVENINPLFVKNVDYRTETPQRTDIEELTKKEIQEYKKYLYGHQESKCNGCQIEFSINNLEIDHITPQVKGGTDTKENLQLLCGYCNRIKGKRPMAYLIAKLNEIKDAKYKF